MLFPYSALGQAAPNLAAISKGRAAVSSIISMIETDSNPSEKVEDGTVLSKVAGQIDFCEVCFAYPSRPNIVFENLSFSVSAGKTFAVVGPSGSGKSTVISMVQRFYEPTSGISYHLNRGYLYFPLQSLLSEQVSSLVKLLLLNYYKIPNSMSHLCTNIC